MNESLIYKAIFLHVLLCSCPLKFSIASALGGLMKPKLAIFLHLMDITRDVAIVVCGPVKQTSEVPA